MMKWKLGVIPLFLTFVVCIAFSALSLATEMPLYVPSYEGEELAAVREWEKTWAGKRVDKTFNCMDEDICYDIYPGKFYKKLKELNKKRTKK